jgi:hypothetical protein
MKLIKIIMFAIIIGITISFSQAWGITYGEPDVDGHPFVAAVVGINSSQDAVRGRCSGTLIQLEEGRSAILTAGHCADFWFAVGNDAVGITFEPVIGGDPNNAMQNSLNPSNYLVGGTVVLHPDYGPRGSWNPKNDLAIVVFDEKVIEGVSAASIVEPNYLSDLKKKELKMIDVKNVGYGIIERLHFPGSNAGGVMPAQGYGVRRVSYLDYSNVIMSVTSSGDSFCRATNIGARVDTPQAVEFINCVLTAEDIDDLEECGIVEIIN